MLPRLRCRAAASCLRLQPHRVLRGRRQQHSSSSSSSSVSPAVQRRKGSTAAIAFDIDGVLLRGKELIPQATEALHLISSKETGGSAVSPLPFIFLTNGGGVSEAEKARELSSWFKLRIAAFSVCVSHTPMQQYLQQYRHRRILVLGLKETDVAAVAHEYGFEDVLTIAQLAARHPDLVPHLQHESTGGEAMEQRRQPQHETAAQAAAAVSSSLTSISAVFVMHDPVQWYRDAQILLDVLTAGASPPPLFFTNPDFLFSGQAASPRLAQGAFRVCIAALYEQMTGRPLPYRLMGKPESVSFQWAEKMLAARAEALGFTGGVHRRYMIGDNPRADIRGANRAGPGWVSVLVKTGTIAASDDPQDRPQHVADNVLEAVKWILQREQQEAQKEQHDVTT